MNTNVFVVFSLALTLGLSFFYTELRDYFNPVEAYKVRVSVLEEKVQKERFRHLLTSYEFADFRTYVATLLPSAIDEKGQGEKSYQLRNLASVTQKSVNENLSITRAHILFEEAKKLFRDKKYSESDKAFALLIKNHPYSAQLPEAMFLLVEGHFNLREYDECIYYGNKMLDLYPDNELTGFSLLRLGKIYEFQDRFEEAIDIYKTVLKSFPQRGVASVASQAIRAVEL